MSLTPTLVEKKVCHQPIRYAQLNGLNVNDVYSQVGLLIAVFKEDRVWSHVYWKVSVQRPDGYHVSDVNVNVNDSSVKRPDGYHVNDVNVNGNDSRADLWIVVFLEDLKSVRRIVSVQWPEVWIVKSFCIFAVFITAKFSTTVILNQKLMSIKTLLPMLYVRENPDRHGATGLGRTLIWVFHKRTKLAILALLSLLYSIHLSFPSLFATYDVSVLSRGVSAWGVSAGGVSQHALRQTPPLLTDTCENITLPQLRCVR